MVRNSEIYKSQLVFVRKHNGTCGYCEFFGKCKEYLIELSARTNAAITLFQMCSCSPELNSGFEERYVLLSIKPI